MTQLFMKPIIVIQIILITIFCTKPMTGMEITVKIKMNQPLKIQKNNHDLLAETITIEPSPTRNTQLITSDMAKKLYPNIEFNSLGKKIRLIPICIVINEKQHINSLIPHKVFFNKEWSFTISSKNNPQKKTQYTCLRNINLLKQIAKKIEFEYNSSMHEHTQTKFLRNFLVIALLASWVGFIVYFLRMHYSYA